MNKSFYSIFISVLFISLSLTLSPIVSNTANKALPFVYAQTNAAMIASTTFVADNTNGNIIGLQNNNSTTSNMTLNLNASTDGIQIKKDVKYFDGASGYLAYPSNATTGSDSKKIPGVIMVHEWWGLNDNIKTMANTLAKQTGYAVLAVDLFKGQSTKDPTQAMQLVKSATNNPSESVSNLQAAVKYLSSLPFVDGSKIASIGWCFGGGQALQLALHSEQHPLVGTVLYYGTPLVTDKQELTKIKWPLLGMFGDKDQSIPLSQINSFKSALDNVGVKNQIYIYKGLGHAFANPSGSSYAPQQTADAWKKTLTFLKSVFNN